MLRWQVKNVDVIGKTHGEHEVNKMIRREWKKSGKGSDEIEKSELLI